MRKLKLNKSNSKLGGVCSGLGDYFNVDPVWFRLAFIIGFYTPIPSFLIYFIMLIILE